MLGVFAVRPAEITPGETQVIDGVQQIGLATAIGTGDGHNSFIKPVIGLSIVSELNEG